MSDTTAPRQIFRPEVVRRFAERQEQAVLPRFLRPRTFLCLWILLALLAGAAVAGWQVRVPERVSGVAMIVVRPGGEPEIVGLLPAAEATRLAAGQGLQLRLPGHAVAIDGTVGTVDPGVVSPAEAAATLGIADPAALGLSAMGPVVVVRAPLGELAGDIAPTAFAGTGGRIDVTVGSRRLTLEILPAGRVSIDQEEHPR
jgi:hypothetical protein